MIIHFAGNCEDTHAKPHFRFVNMNFNALVHCSSELNWILMEYDVLVLESSILPFSILYGRQKPESPFSTSSLNCWRQSKNATIAWSNLVSQKNLKPPDPYKGSSLDLSVRHSSREWLPYGIRRNLSKVRFIFFASEWSNSTVCPQAALISFHSTGTLGSRPSLKLLMVPKCPLCQIWNVALNTLVFFNLSNWACAYRSWLSTLRWASSYSSNCLLYSLYSCQYLQTIKFIGLINAP